MNTQIELPDACTTMTQVREGVDATDRELMVLLDRRFGYMRAAARIKTDRAVVRDEARKAQVIANARADAAARGLAGGGSWRNCGILLVETSIAYELVDWDRLRGEESAPAR